jgi:acetyltransferase-like isoleucine patch superfamily enzyme
MLFDRVKSSYNKLSISDFLRKVFFFVKCNFKFKVFRKLRSIIFFKSLNVKLGKNVSLIGCCYSIKCGRDINLFDNCVFELNSETVLDIGSHVVFSFGCIVSSCKSIKIGSYVQIGEYTSIRDTTHDYNDYGSPMMKNSDKSDSIIIGSDVWIGRGCLIQPGSIIEDGVVVGANSIVKGRLSSGKIYVGNPLREVRSRVL